jgi:hypothetical protein
MKRYKSVIKESGDNYENFGISLSKMYSKSTNMTQLANMISNSIGEEIGDSEDLIKVSKTLIGNLQDLINDAKSSRE